MSLNFRNFLSVSLLCTGLAVTGCGPTEQTDTNTQPTVDAQADLSLPRGYLPKGGKGSMDVQVISLAVPVSAIQAAGLVPGNTTLANEYIFPGPNGVSMCLMEFVVGTSKVSVPFLPDFTMKQLLTNVGISTDNAVTIPGPTGQPMTTKGPFGHDVFSLAPRLAAAFISASGHMTIGVSENNFNLDGVHGKYSVKAPSGAVLSLVVDPSQERPLTAQEAAGLAKDTAPSLGGKPGDIRVTDLIRSAQTDANAKASKITNLQIPDNFVPGLKLGSMLGNGTAFVLGAVHLKGDFVTTDTVRVNLGN